MKPICDMHLPTEVVMEKRPGRTTFKFYAGGPGEFYFEDVYQCGMCGRYYHQKLGYIHAPDQKNNRRTLPCLCQEGHQPQMAISGVGDDPDIVILGCVVCDKETAPLPIK